VAIFGTLFGGAKQVGQTAVGTAIGVGVSGALTPGVQELINEANSQFPLKPPSYFMLAEGVAKGRVDADWAREWAKNQGISNDAFNRLVEVARIGPGLDVAFQLWRRKIIDPAGFAEAVKEETISADWLPRLEELHDVLLSPAELANARQQEFIADDRLHSEGELQGYTNERMDLLYKMAGLPPGPMEGLEMLRRNIPLPDGYAGLIAEGHTKTKYTDAFLALENHILSGHELAGLVLRGWLTEAEGAALAKLDGWDTPQFHQLVLNRGRPATTHQVHIGFARGGRLAEAGNDEQATFKRAIQESDIRPEWFDILWAQRYTYPSAFVTRALTQDGTFDEAQAEQILLFTGWEPTLAKQTATKWAAPSGTTTAKWAGRAQTRLFTTAHNEYMVGHIDEAQARALLTELGALVAESDQTIRLWDAEQAILSRELTQAQILKLHKKGLITDADALERLEYHGLSTDDATKLLTASG
jgi:hypothetical protein